MMTPTTLRRHLTEESRKYLDFNPDLSEILNDIGVAGKLITKEVRRAGIANILGATGEVNVQEELVQKLDVYAQTTMVATLEHSGKFCGMVSEEVEDIISIDDRYPKGPYVAMFDPLDGSSNIDANASIGTIFSIYRRVSSGPCAIQDILQPVKNQIAAGYLIYGSSTMLVYTAGYGVYGFTLDPEIGEYILSNPQLTFPSECTYYSVNESNFHSWDEPIQRFVQYLRDESGASSRYIGSFIADFHRNLVRGGIFLYPGSKKKPNGKLRLLHEVAAMSWIAEQAGGAATTGEQRILDLTPAEIHQRVPLIIGHRAMVEKYQDFAKLEESIH